MDCPFEIVCKCALLLRSSQLQSGKCGARGASGREREKGGAGREKLNSLLFSAQRCQSPTFHISLSQPLIQTPWSEFAGGQRLRRGRPGGSGSGSARLCRSAASPGLVALRSDRRLGQLIKERVVFLRCSRGRCCRRPKRCQALESDCKASWRDAAAGRC